MPSSSCHIEDSDQGVTLVLVPDECEHRISRANCTSSQNRRRGYVGVEGVVDIIEVDSAVSLGGKKAILGRKWGCVGVLDPGGPGGIPGFCEVEREELVVADTVEATLDEPGPLGPTGRWVDDYIWLGG